MYLKYFMKELECPDQGFDFYSRKNWEPHR